jgi:hypothetical protein
LWWRSVPRAWAVRIEILKAVLGWLGLMTGEKRADPEDPRR